MEKNWVYIANSTYIYDHFQIDQAHKQKLLVFNFQTNNSSYYEFGLRKRDWDNLNKKDKLRNYLIYFLDLKEQNLLKASGGLLSFFLPKNKPKNDVFYISLSQIYYLINRIRDISYNPKIVDKILGVWHYSIDKGKFIQIYSNKSSQKKQYGK